MAGNSGAVSRPNVMLFTHLFSLPEIHSCVVFLSLLFNVWTKVHSLDRFCGKSKIPSLVSRWRQRQPLILTVGVQWRSGTETKRPTLPFARSWKVS